jgi:hypothetical protein
MQDLGYELPRILILGSRVNKARTRAEAPKDFDPVD